MGPLAPSVSETDAGQLRMGDLDRLDRVVMSLRGSPIRPPAVASRGQGRRVCCPAPLSEVSAGISGTLIDASVDVCRWVRQRAGAGDAVVVCGSLHLLPFPPRVIDEFVVPAYSLQTLPDAAQILRETRRVLRPGSGRLRTWFLLWPSDGSVERAQQVVSAGGLRSTYVLTEDDLAIRREDESTGFTTGGGEQWTIKALRRDGAEAMFYEAGFAAPDWLVAAGSEIGGLTIVELECRA